MGLKPIDQRKDIDTRETLWAEIRRIKTFTIDDLLHVTRMDRSSIRHYLTGLTNAGYLSKEDSEPDNTKKTAMVYTLQRNPGVIPPRVRKDGSPVTQGTGRYLMWSTMRIIRTFTAKELAIQASIEEHVVAIGEANKYCQLLAQAGYLKVVAGGKSGTLATYRLIKRTGPRPPQIQRVKRVYDPNIRQVVWDSKEGRYDQK